MAKRRSFTEDAPETVQTPQPESAPQTDTPQTGQPDMATDLIADDVQTQPEKSEYQTRYDAIIEKLARKTDEGGASDRPLVNALDPDCAVDKLAKRYTEAQRIAILDAIDAGAVVFQVRVVTIKAEKAKAQSDAMINYVTFLPTGVTVDRNGNAIDATLGMTVLSHGVFVRDSDFAD